MSVQEDRGAGWFACAPSSGRQRGKRFGSEEAVRAFDAGLREVSPRERRTESVQLSGGVYPYPTPKGTR